MKTQQLGLQKYQLITNTDNNILQYIPINCFKNGTQKLGQKIKLKLTTKGNQYDEYFTDAFSIKDLDPTNQFYQNIQDLLNMLSESSNFKISVDEDGESKWLHLYVPGQQQAILDILFKKYIQIQTLCHQIYKKCQSQEELTDIDIKNLFKLVSKNLKVILNRTQNKNLFVLNKKSSYHSSGLQNDINFQVDEYFSKSKNLEDNQKKLQQSIIKIHQQLQIQSRGGKADKQYQQKLNKKIQQYKNQLKQTKQKSQHLQKTIKNLPIELSKQLNDILKLTNSQIQNKTTNLVSKKQEIKKAIDTVDENCNHFQRLKFNNNQIIAMGPANIFFKLKDIKEFKIKVNRLHNYIGIGLVNSNYNRQAKIGQDFMKYGSNGCYFDGKSQKYGNTPFRQGQELTMIVDFKQGRIGWKTNQKQIYATEHPKLKNSKIKWIPYILMMDAQDSVILLK